MKIERKTLIYPLLCWDVAYGFKPFFWGPHRDILKLEAMQEEKSWHTEINFQDMLKRYKAVIVTTLEQNIEWVSTGFQHMTGYAPIEVIGKNPGFLQGDTPKSTSDTRKISQALVDVEPVHAKVLNYKKSGEPYVCELDIFPLFNEDKELVNFIAFENESTPLNTMRPYKV